MRALLPAAAAAILLAVAPQPAPAQGTGTGGDAGGLLQKFLKAIEERDKGATATEPAGTPATGAEAGAEAGTATGAPVILDASDPAAVLAIAQRYGQAELTADSIGDPMITGMMDPYNYVVYFYGCAEHRDCTTLMFQALFTSSGQTAEQMAEWNRSQRFATAYLDTDGDPTIEMDVNLFGGVTESNLDDTFDWWRVVMGSFADSIAN